MDNTSEESPLPCLFCVNSFCRSSRWRLSSASFAFFARISSLRCCIFVFARGDPKHTIKIIYKAPGVVSMYRCRRLRYEGMDGCRETGWFRAYLIRGRTANSELLMYRTV